MRSKLKTYARSNRKRLTKAEGLFWHMIVKKHLTGYRFIRQKVMGTYIVDFYCPKLKLAVELDGSSHENRDEDDLKRQSDLQSNGILVIRYSNELIERELDGVFYHLQDILKVREKSLSK